jgi:hypothetical protein
MSIITKEYFIMMTPKKTTTSIQSMEPISNSTICASGSPISKLKEINKKKLCPKIHKPNAKLSYSFLTRGLSLLRKQNNDLENTLSRNTQINAKSQQGLSSGTDGSQPSKVAKIAVIDPFHQKANTFDMVRKRKMNAKMHSDITQLNKGDCSLTKGHSIKQIKPISKNIHSIISKIIGLKKKNVKKTSQLEKINPINEGRNHQDKYHIN